VAVDDIEKVQEQTGSSIYGWTLEGSNPSPVAMSNQKFKAMKNYSIKVYVETKNGVDKIFIDDLTMEQAYEYYQRRMPGDVFQVSKEVNGEIIDVKF